MAPESKPEKTEHGLVPTGEGWFVLNMRDAEWRHADGRGAVCVALDDFEGERQFEQLGLTYSGRANRWPCTTGRPIRRASSSSRAQQF
jgi:hypothetical protein